MIKKSAFTILIVLFLFFFNNNTIKANEDINVYDGELGVKYTNSVTTFTIWSSSANEIEVIVEGTVNETQKLVKDYNTNVWIGSIAGDLLAAEYSYNIKYEDGTFYENVLDPYGKYFNATKTRNIIYSNNLTNYSEWYEIGSSLEIKDKNKIIYGINIESFSQSSSWNGSEENRGNLLALKETGTKYNNSSTGFDHIKSLGVTNIELSNIADKLNPFAIDSKYVSGDLGYSGNIELKQVVSAFYYNNIGVIATLDFLGEDNEFINTLKKIDREYYVTSNDYLDLTKYMTRKYITDIILYWVNEYKLTGLKLENLSEYDIDLINVISEKLMEINSCFTFYGDGSYSTDSENKASENNLDKMDNVRLLNNSLNYALFGELENKDVLGILAGSYNDNLKESLKFTLLSSVDNGDINYSLVNGISYKGYWGNHSSYQIINNLGDREGLSIYDKLIINNLLGDTLIKQKIILAFATVMISGGIPYIESGNEFLASYRNLDNNGASICDESGNFCFYTLSSKKVIDWSFAYDNKSIVDSVKSLINFRKSDASIIQSSAINIKNNIKIFEGEKGNIGYIRNYPNAYVNEIQNIYVIFNYSNHDYTINQFKNKGEQTSYNYNMSNREGDNINMKANSFYIESQTRPPVINQWIMLIIVIGVIGLLYTFNIFLNKKLVENKGYDIKDISRKYRPFINKKNIEEVTEADEERVDDNSSGENDDKIK